MSAFVSLSLRRCAMVAKLLITARSMGRKGVFARVVYEAIRRPFDQQLFYWQLQKIVDAPTKNS